MACFCQHNSTAESHLRKGLRQINYTVITMANKILHKPFFPLIFPSCSHKASQTPVAKELWARWGFERGSSWLSCREEELIWPTTKTTVAMRGGETSLVQPAEENDKRQETGERRAAEVALAGRRRGDGDNKAQDVSMFPKSELISVRIGSCWNKQTTP